MVTKQRQRKRRIPKANAGGFFMAWTFDQLARMQGVEPLKDLKALVGGWPDDEDLDEVLDDIYEQRH